MSSRKSLPDEVLSALGTIAILVMSIPFWYVLKAEFSALPAVYSAQESGFGVPMPGLGTSFIIAGRLVFLAGCAAALLYIAEWKLLAAQFPGHRGREKANLWFKYYGDQPKARNFIYAATLGFGFVVVVETFIGYAFWPTVIAPVLASIAFVANYIKFDHAFAADHNLTGEVEILVTESASE